MRLGYFENAFNPRDEARVQCRTTRAKTCILMAYMSGDFRRGMDASLDKRSAELQSEVVLSGALQSSAKIEAPRRERA